MCPMRSQPTHLICANVFPLGRASNVGCVSVGFFTKFFLYKVFSLVITSYPDKSTFSCSVSFVMDRVF